MSIRLNQALRELNIGLNTAVEYLRKKNLASEGEEITQNTKLTDEQYEALTTGFKDDKAVHTTAGSILMKKVKEKEKRKTKRNVIRKRKKKLLHQPLPYTNLWYWER